MKPKGMATMVELRIREAIRRGELDDLPGAGKPLDLNDLCGLSHEERVDALLLRSLGDLPEEVKLLKQLAELRDDLEQATDDAQRAQLRSTIHAKAVRLSVLFEKAGRNLSAADIVKQYV